MIDQATDLFDCSGSEQTDAITQTATESLMIACQIYNSPAGQEVVSAASAQHPLLRCALHKVLNTAFGLTKEQMQGATFGNVPTSSGHVCSAAVSLSSTATLANAIKILLPTVNIDALPLQISPNAALSALAVTAPSGMKTLAEATRLSVEVANIFSFVLPGGLGTLSVDAARLIVDQPFHSSRKLQSAEVVARWSVPELIEAVVALSPVRTGLHIKASLDWSGCKNEVCKVVKDIAKADKFEAEGTLTGKTLAFSTGGKMSLPSLPSLPLSLRGISLAAFTQKIFTAITSSFPNITVQSIDFVMTALFAKFGLSGFKFITDVINKLKLEGITLHVPTISIALNGLLSLDAPDLDGIAMSMKLAFNLNVLLPTISAVLSSLPTLAGLSPRAPSVATILVSIKMAFNLGSNHDVRLTRLLSFSLSSLLPSFDLSFRSNGKVLPLKIGECADSVAELFNYQEHGMLLIITCFDGLHSHVCFAGELCIDFKATATKIGAGVNQATETAKQLVDKAVEVDQNLGLGLNMELLASALNVGTRVFIVCAVMP